MTKSLIKQIANQPITLQELNLLRHVDELLKGQLKIKVRIGTRKKGIAVGAGVFHKLLIYWDFHTNKSRFHTTPG